MNLRIWAWFWCLFDLTVAQLYFYDQTIYESLATISPILHKSIQLSSSNLLIDLFDKQENITVFLPIDSYLNYTISIGQLNFSQPDSTMEYFKSFTLNGTYQSQTFKNSRRLYPTLSDNRLSIGPYLTPDYKLANNSLVVYSGTTKASIHINDIYCKNGIVQVVSQSLEPAQSPLDTISLLPETQYMEELLKTLNVSDIVSDTNRTILVPTNQAWTNANGSSIPFGTLVHDLSYLSLEGVYFADQLSTGGRHALPTSYKDSDIVIQLKKNKLLVNNIAEIIEQDIITTAGVMHMIDAVVLADSAIDENQNGTDSSNSSDVFANDHDSGNSHGNTSLNRSEASCITHRSPLYALVSLCLFFIM
ncbi:FAS1 domain-containing protein [Choanephora cucurbitarum]|nr:FAS1 domain-containing protein [Choanephora cucurbitarum]